MAVSRSARMAEPLVTVIKRTRRRRGAQALPPLPVVAALRPPTVRVARLGGDVRSAYVTKAEVRAEYRAATLLPQAYGVWFNARWWLRYGDYGVTVLAATRRVFSDLTHELGMRLRDWTGAPDLPLHWLAQHKVSAARGFETYLLLHLPAAHTTATAAWLAAFLPVPDGALVNAVGPEVSRAPPVGGRAAMLHWSLVRELWRVVHPDLEEPDGPRRRPLVEALGVPSQGRRAAGALPAGARRYGRAHDCRPRSPPSHRRHRRSLPRQGHRLLAIPRLRRPSRRRIGIHGRLRTGLRRQRPCPLHAAAENPRTQWRGRTL